MNNFMKKILFILTIILIGILFSQKLYAEELKIYTQGKEPKIDKEEIDERYYRTHKALHSPDNQYRGCPFAGQPRGFLWLLASS